MEREPLSSEADALWRRLWEIWQDNDEEDVVLDSTELAELEEEIPGLENRMKPSSPTSSAPVTSSTAPGSARMA
jgi:hypothetical protein